MIHNWTGLLDTQTERNKSIRLKVFARVRYRVCGGCVRIACMQINDATYICVRTRTHTHTRTGWAALIGSISLLAKIATQLQTIHCCSLSWPLSAVTLTH